MLDLCGIAWRVRGTLVDRPVAGNFAPIGLEIEVNGGHDYRRCVSAEQIGGWEVLQ
jgi:hypothetical protein